MVVTDCVSDDCEVTGFSAEVSPAVLCELSLCDVRSAFDELLFPQPQSSIMHIRTSTAVFLIILVISFTV